MAVSVIWKDGEEKQSTSYFSTLENSLTYH